MVVARRYRLCSSVVLFLDFDDVVCLNNPFGGYDVALALANSPRSTSEARYDCDIDPWLRLFDAKAIALLGSLHEEFLPEYVLSTSWWWLMDDNSLKEALVRGGLRFVADNMHPDSATPKATRPDLRWTEISNWLDAHPEFCDAWVVLDDELSGTGLCIAQPEERQPFIVLCTEGVGLTEIEYRKLRIAFSLRAGQRELPEERSVR